MLDIFSYHLGEINGRNKALGKYPFIGYDAELIDETLIEVNLKNDTTFDEWTASTTATIIDEMGAEADFSIDADYSKYIYVVSTKAVSSIAAVSETDLKKFPFKYGRITVYEVLSAPVSYAAMNNNNANGLCTSKFEQHRLFAYNSSGNLTCQYSAEAEYYGAMSISDPKVTGSIANGKLNYFRGSIYAQCNASYFETAKKDKVDSEQTNMDIHVEIYRAPIEYDRCKYEFEKFRELMVGD